MRGEATDHERINERRWKIHPLRSSRVPDTEINVPLPNGDEDPGAESLDGRHDQHLGT